MLALVATPILGTSQAVADGGSGLPSWVSVLATVIVSAGGGGGLFQLLKIRSDNKSIAAGTSKARAEAADILSDTAVALLAPLREELTRTNARVAELDTQVEGLKVTLNQERVTSEIRIKQLESDISARDRTLRVRDAEIIELRAHLKSDPGWPDRA